MSWPLPLLLSRIRGRTTPPKSSIDLPPRRRTLLPASSGRPPPHSCRGSSHPRGSSSDNDLHQLSLSASSANHRHTIRHNMSTGISYLDMWMGNNQTNGGGERRSPSPSSESILRPPHADNIRHAVPPSASPSASLPISSHSALTRNNTHFATNVAATYTSSSNVARFRHLPSATYQMFSLRPTKTDTPETLLGRLDELVKEEAFDEIDNSKNSNGHDAAAVTSSSIIPLVLDLSAFHPDGSPHSPTVSLSKFVEAIRSYREEGEEGKSTASGGPSYRLVGVANIPHHDTSMADEARYMKLPVFCIGSSDGTTSTKSSSNPPASPSKREKRGGVAPLLRQRRPGVAATNKRVNDDSSTLTTRVNDDSSTLTTRDDASTESSSDIHIVGMGALAPHDQACNNTKVHRGSIRSGQLLSSDRPNQSLVIIGSVNPGGEVWSEGDVYVFGKLRGRVLAGLSDVGGGGDSSNTKGEAPKDDGTDDGASAKTDDGHNNGSDSIKSDDSQGAAAPSSGANHPKPKDSTSKIFATTFDPELVCIGHKFMTVDDVAQSCGLSDGVGPAMVTVDEVTGELLFEKIEL